MEQTYPLNKIRNIGIIAHIDAGKTTTSERILFYTGKTHKIGDIDEGSTQMDWMAQERERGITIASAATTCFWKDCRINVIDTPGHVDFTAEVERSLRVLDGGVILLDGSQGVEPQSETVFRQAQKYNVPLLFFINKLDKLGGDFYMSLDSIGERLTNNAVAVQLPVGIEGGFNAVIDLIERKAYTFSGKLGSEISEVEIPEDMKEKVEQYRLKLVEKIAEGSDSLMERYLNGEELSVEDIKEGVRAMTIRAELHPVFCGASLGNIGVQKLLDGVIDYLPSPLEKPEVIAHHAKTGEDVPIVTSVDGKFVALAFKIQTDPYVGRLTYFRVYSGTLEAGSYVINTRSGVKERIGRILLMHANHREDIKSLSAGEIGATVGLKNTTTGDTLCDESLPLILESITFPEPVISLAIEPKTKVDQEHMGVALQNLAEEDPTFSVRTDEESGQVIISGMGELQLDILVDRMKREFNVDALVGKPQVSYRETIKKEVEYEGKYIHQSGGRGQYGHVFLRIKPLTRGEGVKFSNEIKGGVIPKEYIPAIEKGVREALSGGVVFGYPVLDIEVAVFDGSYHEVDSSEAAFKVAASRCVKEAVNRADPVLLEPIMKVEVRVPSDYVGDVIGDLSSRRGQIQGTSQKGDIHSVAALLPLADMFGYATSLRSLTQGRGSFNMEPSHYEEVPAGVAAQVAGKTDTKN